MLFTSHNTIAYIYIYLRLIFPFFLSFFLSFFLFPLLIYFLKDVGKFWSLSRSKRACLVLHKFSISQNITYEIWRNTFFALRENSYLLSRKILDISVTKFDMAVWQIGLLLFKKNYLIWFLGIEEKIPQSYCSTAHIPF